MPFAPGGWTTSVRNAPVHGRFDALQRNGRHVCRHYCLISTWNSIPRCLHATHFVTYKVKFENFRLPLMYVCRRRFWSSCFQTISPKEHVKGETSAHAVDGNVAPRRRWFRFFAKLLAFCVVCAQQVNFWSLRFTVSSFFRRKSMRCRRTDTIKRCDVVFS